MPAAGWMISAAAIIGMDVLTRSHWIWMAVLWIDPHETGLYLGQCAQYCGTQHAKMLLRVYVEPRADFDRWVERSGSRFRRLFRWMVQPPKAGVCSRPRRASTATWFRARWRTGDSDRT